MKVVVLGGTGRVGSKIVEKLGEHGHEAIAASPESGVNAVTGEGLTDALTGTDVVIDASNSPSFDDAAVMEFFETSTRNVLAAEQEAGVGHHVALSVVGTDRMAEGGYIRAKLAQEKLIKSGPIPYSIVHATQFFEFAKAIAGAATDGNTVRVPAGALIQPIAADEVAATVAKVAVSEPLNGTAEVAGPEAMPFEEFIRRELAAHDDPREVVADDDALYFDAKLHERTLLPGDGAIIAATRFEDWLEQTAEGAVASR